MKICFISPYIPKHTGGGERYLLDCARVAATKHQVQVGVPIEPSILKKPTEVNKLLSQAQKRYQRFLGNDLAGVTFVPTPLFTSARSLTKLAWTGKFDLIYYATDGSLFWSLAKRNILHIQIPLQQKKSLVDKLKLKNWQVINTNSEFTKQTIELWWGIKVDEVHWPMAEIKPIPSIPKLLDQKEKIILHVGRFFRQLHSKRQDVLVEIFKLLKSKYHKETKGWKLVLVGSVEDEEYAEEVSKKSKGQDIEIHHQVSRAELWEWYDRATIYWHATGYGLDETEHPEKVEHFGISTLEAMSRGCVPIVINKGGQPEVLGSTLLQLLWSTQEECVNITHQTITNKTMAEKNARLSIDRAGFFKEDRFAQQLFKMIEAKI